MGVRSWWLNSVAASPLWHPRIRRRMLQAAGCRIGRARIMHGVVVGGAHPRGLTVGDGVFINIGVSLHPSGGLTIGERAFIGPHAVLMTGTHDVGPSEQRATVPSRFAPVHIGAGSWIGAGAIVQGGVKIGHGCVVAPGSVVTADCEADGFYAGAPAVRKRDLPT